MQAVTIGFKVVFETVDDGEVLIRGIWFRLFRGVAGRRSKTRRSNSVFSRPYY